MGSDGLSITTSKQVCCAAVEGVDQSHSKIAGSVGDTAEIILAGPIENQPFPLAKLVQKLVGKEGNPAEASAKKSLTVTLAPGVMPRL
jgi:hypothetical protein